MAFRYTVLVVIALLVLPAAAQTLYRYQDAAGNWHFTDRPPEQQDSGSVVKQTLVNPNLRPKITLQKVDENGRVRLVAYNEFYGPAELLLEFTERANLTENVEKRMTFVVPGNRETPVMEFGPRNPSASWRYAYRFAYMLGDPQAKHDDSYIYRAPYSLGSTHPVTQAYPQQLTHTDPGSLHAIDFAMPEGTPVHAARGGTVLSIAFDSYTGGTDIDNDMPKANLVRILHDDGTMAVYAHLRWQAIRVRPGQRIREGQYIADSGNTGFSSGPHLHFAVQRNTGLTTESVPIQFRNIGSPVAARGGLPLTAH